MAKEQKEMIEWVIAVLDEIQSRSETTAIYDMPKFVAGLKKDFLGRFAPKPMTFMEAVEVMKQGKKVRREAWSPEFYISIEVNSGIDSVLGEDSKRAHFLGDDFTATDWQIIEEGV